MMKGDTTMIDFLKLCCAAAVFFGLMGACEYLGTAVGNTLTPTQEMPEPEYCPHIWKPKHPNCYPND